MDNQIENKIKEDKIETNKKENYENIYDTYPRLRIKRKFIRRTNPLKNEQSKENNIGKFPPENNLSNQQHVKSNNFFTDECSDLKIGEIRKFQLHFVWQINFRENKIYQNNLDIKKFKGRDNVYYICGIVYVNKNINNATLIYAFQNGENLNEEKFQEQLLLIGNNLINERNIFIKFKEAFRQNYLSLNNNNSNQINDNLNEDAYFNNLIKKRDDILLYGLYLLNQNIFCVKVDNDKDSEKNDSDINSDSREEEINEDEEEFEIVTSISCPSYSSKVTRFKNIQRGKIILSILNIPSKAYLDKDFLTIVIEQKMNRNDIETKKYKGIINEGMTCYLNSMMQSYNALSLFKKGIFFIPFERYQRTLSSSLQRFFFDLTFGTKIVSTNRLINSFGWSRDDIFIQHDIQEFNMMLSDLIEKKFKGTKAEETFNYLFEGKTINEIKCVDYEFKSEKEEKFNDIQLNVKSCKNIYDSLNEFTKEEILDGDDKYEVEGHGKEKVIKKMKFIKLPPVLIFQLKRFEFNSELNYIDKLNDYYEFYDSINMNNYIDDKNNDYTYILVSVIVHKGNVFGGHYYAYINQDPEHKNENWFVFNDEKVCKAQLFEVFNNNFGGEFSYPKFKIKNNKIHINRNYSDLSAYILLYIQKSKMKEILNPIKMDEIPQELLYEINLQKKGEKLHRIIRKNKIKYEREKNGNYFIRPVCKLRKLKKKYHYDDDCNERNNCYDSRYNDSSESSDDDFYDILKNKRYIRRYSIS